MAGKARGPRVIAGELGGRRLVVPAGHAVRPTTDRVKESVFSALGDWRLRGASVLDLYAGSGALGIEALSRGGRQAVFVDRDRGAAAAVEQNLAALGLAGRARAVRAEVGLFMAGDAPPEAPFDLVLLDPPYDQPEEHLAAVLAGLASPAWTGAETVVVVERADGSGIPWPPGWGSTWERCYGDTLVLFGSSSEEGS